MTAPTRFIAGRQGLIDGTGAGLRPGAGLLLEGARIAAVGPAAEVCPPGVDRIDLGDTVLVPGFVDAHTHVTVRPGEGDQHRQLRQAPAWQAVRGVDNLRRMLQSGVTTARIMTEEHGIDLEFRAAVARGEVAGPRLRVAGRGLAPPGGHGGGTGGVAGVQDLRAAVRRNAELGADHIKIFTTGGVSSTDSSLEDSNYSAEEIAAIVDEAARAGLTVSAHAHGGPGVDLAVDAGVRSIEHGALLTPGNVERMVAAGTWLVQTNTILFHPAGIERGDAREPAVLAKVRQAREQMTTRTVALVRDAGIPFALGTDSMHGLFGYELQWLVEHGWSPAVALVAATRNGARVLGVAEETGTLEPGKLADVVALRGDPLTDIRAVYDVAAVYQGGRLAVDAAGAIHPALPATAAEEGGTA